jgi:hypothetical protein
MQYPQNSNEITENVPNLDIYFESHSGWASALAF